MRSKIAESNGFNARNAVFWLVAGYRPIALIPFFLVATYWLAGEHTMTVVAAVLPASAVILSLLANRHLDETGSGLTTRSLETAETWLNNRMENAEERAKATVMSVTVDNLDRLEERVGVAMNDAIIAELGFRLREHLRGADLVTRGMKSDFLICLDDIRSPESESLLHLSRRLQTCLDEPFRNGEVRVYCSITIGIARAGQLEAPTAGILIRAAEAANREARNEGPGAVRLYKSAYGKAPRVDNDLTSQLASALENGEIIAWYQPQISTHTGEISGFEALARWEHPTRGLISPATFLGLIDKLGLSQRLAEVVLTHALSSLRTWDRAGLTVPSVSVNYSEEELKNPRLPEFIKWELERYELKPNRLTIEVLENVIAKSQDDIIARNLRALSDMGCQIDLDDFGTGYTSILNIRTFSVSRLKIDRRLIARIDVDQDQRALVSALLAMSEQLGIETLGEGVETAEEHAMLAQLGCDHIQGFHLARPMPRGDSINWISDYCMDLEDRSVLSNFPTKTSGEQ